MMKNNFKHIIALLFVLVMSFQMAAFVVADETAATEEVVEEEVYAPQNLREFRILKSLGLFKIYEEEDFTGNSELSRAEAAAVAARMVGIVRDYSMEGKILPYTDVASEDDYAYEIYHMTNLGIMSGYNGEFNPDGSITEEQFVKVVVEVLGYGTEAQTMGGYPHGYTITAGKYHVLDNVNYKGAVPITQDVAVQIVYNCLNIEMPEVVSVENGGFLTTVGNTIMSQYLDVTRDYGILKRNSNTYINIGEASKDGVVQIGNEYYYTGTSNCEQYIGLNVEFFYKKTAEDELGTILYAAPWNNEVIHVDAQDIVGYANHEYTYYIDNIEKRTKANVYVLYNGVLAKSGFKNHIPEIGYVEFINNDDDSDVDVVSICDYKLYHISSNNTTEFIISSKDKDNKQIKKYNEIDWLVTDAAGEELPAANVAKDMVLLLAVSEDQKVVRGFQIDKQVEGTIDSTYTEGKSQYVVINNIDYKVHSNCKDMMGSQIKLGKYAGFYVYDNMLLVKCLPASSLTESVGYLIDIGATSGLESTIMLRMLTQTNGVQILNVNEKAKLVCYGKQDVKPENFAAALKYELEKYNTSDTNGRPTDISEMVVHQPVVYKLNDAGEIIYLEVAPGHNYSDVVNMADLKTEGMQLVSFMRSAWTRLNVLLRSAGIDQVVFDENSFIIDIPTDLENYDLYKIYHISTVTSRDYDAGEIGTRINPWRFYRTGNDILGANIMVGTDIFKSSGSGNSAFVVDKIRESITDDGVECYMLSGKTTSLGDISVKTLDKSVVDAFKGTEYEVSEGDLISCSRNSYGLADSITIYYDNETSKLLNSPGTYAYHASPFIVGGQVYIKKDDVIGYYNGIIPDGGVTGSSVKYIDASKFKIVVYDSTLERTDSHIINASSGDIKSYLDDPSNVSSILATRQSGNFGILVIYK